MKDDRRNYVIVGAFVLTAFVGLIVWLALIAGRTGPTDDYYIVYDNVMGLQSGTQILFEGYPVGLIESIEPVVDSGRQRFRVDVSVRRGWIVPEDSLARITAPGLLSAFAIDIRGGSSPRALEPGSAITGVEASNVLDVVADVGALLDTTIAPWLDEMSKGTLSISENLEGFTSDLGSTMARVDALLGEPNIERIDRILGNLDATSANVNSLTANLDSTQKALEQLLADVDGFIELNQGEVTKAISEARFTLEALSRYVESVAFNLDETMRNMNEFSREIRENPGVLLRGRAPGGSSE